MTFGVSFFIGRPFFCFDALAWPAAFWVAFLVEHRGVRSEEKRIESGMCARCGYTLAGLARISRDYEGKTLTLAACPECGLWNGEMSDDPAVR